MVHRYALASEIGAATALIFIYHRWVGVAVRAA